MDKIQIIEKLFSYSLLYSYLLIPLLIVFNKQKKDRLTIALAIYGLVFFLFLYFYFDIPKEYRKAQQAIYTTLEYSFFAFIYFRIIDNVKIRGTIVICSILFVLFQLGFYFMSPLQRVDSVSIGIETIFILFFTFLYFQEYFKTNLSDNIYQYSSFWLIVGIIIFLGFSFFLNILANHISSEQLQKYWHFTYIPEILKNLMFGLVISGLWVNKSKYSKMKNMDIPNLDMI